MRSGCHLRDGSKGTIFRLIWLQCHKHIWGSEVKLSAFLMSVLEKYITFFISYYEYIHSCMDMI